MCTPENGHQGMPDAIGFCAITVHFIVSPVAGCSKASLREARNTLATQEKTVAQGTGTSQSGIHVIRYAEGRS